MQPQKLEPFDLHRLLVGQGTPWWFLLETVGRIGLIYLLLMTAMRLMGKRVASQMSLTELAIVVTLGAAVGVPMQSPDRGMLPALLILIVAVLFERGLGLLAFKSRRVEIVTQSDVSVLVQEGELMLDSMRVSGISRERLFAVLRGEGIEQLGAVRRVYLESTGDMSIFKMSRPRPGLVVLPGFDADMLNDLTLTPGKWACRSCGRVFSAQNEPIQSCDRCEHRLWTPAVGKPLAEEDDDARDEGAAGAREFVGHAKR